MYDIARGKENENRNGIKNSWLDTDNSCVLA